ncbi:MAG: hypothetical protein UX09_C0002G0018 [Candidatus Uhrbacteria bacterium GW2011_GWE2_45_35]|uniref:YYY membrane protein n=2 Tax=Candidatus Uhriibacteriota TaxID=1752732 RepID=A0A0G1JK20_9BACT|nr:MAG: hypothetical protein UW63_C0004G0007 [Candidatus Uhrbacteria bacterium GW2011_GWF2_44_350]KKU09175.1 MAG: hypothetical protein UX09_C0002G0018 [Candidatus Uhrbacteria bacterium GW2011_GWE2_45_35]HBR80106.1 hypothetical protein [Candidatus Uhrbacteria bacterium]HCU31208.1 hypothetical protein [Candidatus Uhrbacteria bacterium]
MKRLLTNMKFTTLSIIFLATFVANTFVFKSELTAVILLVFFAFLIIPPLGRATTPREGRLTQLLFGFFTAFSLVAIIGSLAYYLANFTKPVVVVIILIAPSLVWLLWQRQPAAFKKVAAVHNILSGLKHQIKKSVWIAVATAVSLLAATGLLINQAATTEAVRSPWEVVTPAIFLTFGLASLLLVALTAKGHERTLTIPLVSLALFVFLSVVLMVFPIGYGFDAFIHQATEGHIAEFGTITPTPFYYIGQYAMVLFLHHGFQIPIDWADKLLLPLLTALLLPLAWLSAAAHALKEKTSAVRSLPFLFLIPLSSFIVTTPQGLGNLWFVLIILMASPRLIDRNNQPLWPLIFGAITALLIHPIAGIPALLFLALLATNPDDPQQKFPGLARVFSWIIILFGSFALPASFAINSWRSGQGLNLNFSALTPSQLVHNLRLDLFLENHFSPLLDFVYFFGWNQIALIILGAIIGIFYARKTVLKPLRIYLAMAAMLFINFVVMGAAVDFSFLIDYERGNYTARLLPLAIFCLLPFLIIFAGRSLTSLKEKPIVLRTGVIVLLSALMVSAFYLNYPRQDVYETSHGFNVSQADIAAALDVEKDAGQNDFVVLANQSAAAAALSQFGFVHYYGEQFYYPIPTGGELYQIFLEMNEHPARETALAAMDLVGVDKVYYLVSDYWWQAEKIIETAKTTTDNWWSVQEGRVTIFEYGR